MTTLTYKVNSYATLSTADALLDNRLGSTAWSSKTDNDKEKALITATAMIDMRFAPFIGEPFSTSQTLAFPKKDITYFDSRLNSYIDVAADTIPDRIQHATVLLALHLLSNEDTFFGGEDTTAWTSLGLDDLKIQRNSPSDVGLRKVSTFPVEVHTLVQDFVYDRTNASSPWWRVN